MLSIHLKHQNRIICKAKLIEVNENNRGINIIRLKQISLLKLGEYLDKKMIIDVLIHTKKYGMVVWMKGIVYPENLNESDGYIEINGEFIASDDYHPYDQKLINHIYNYWDNPENLVDRSDFDQKDFCLYLDALAIFHNFPEQLHLKSNYVLDGNTIQNKCDLFIQIGELLAGKQVYFCYNLDVLEKSLRYHFKSFHSKIPFEIRNKEKIIQQVSEKYFKTLIEVMSPFFELKLD